MTRPKTGFAIKALAAARWHLAAAGQRVRAGDAEGAACRAHFAAAHAANAFAAWRGHPSRLRDPSDDARAFVEVFCAPTGEAFPASLRDALAELRRLHDKVAWRAEPLTADEGREALRHAEGAIEAIQGQLPESVTAKRAPTPAP